MALPSLIKPEQSERNVKTMSVIFGHVFLVHQRSGFKGPLHLCVGSYLALTLLAVERAPAYSQEEVDGDYEVTALVIKLYEGGGEG